MLGADAVVQVAGQHTLFHDIGLLPLHAFVVKVHGTAVEGNRTVVHHVDVFVANLLAEQVAEDGSAFAVEIRLKSVSDGLVQQDARTSGTHHHRHLAAFRLHCLEEDGGFLHRLASQHFYDVVRQELEAFAVGTGGIAVLHLSILLHDADCREGDHRAVVVVAHAFGIAEQHVRRAVRQRSLHLAHAAVQRKNLFVQLFQIGDFGLDAGLFPRFADGVTALGQCLLGEVHRFSRLARRGDAGGRAGGAHHLVQRHALHVGIARLVAGKHTHTHAKVDVGTAPVHLAVHQGDAVVKRMLKIEVGIIASFFQGGSHHLLQVGFRHAEMSHRRSYGRLLVSPIQGTSHQCASSQHA